MAKKLIMGIITTTDYDSLEWVPCEGENPLFEESRLPDGRRVKRHRREATAEEKARFEKMIDRSPPTEADIRRAQEIAKTLGI